MRLLRIAQQERSLVTDMIGQYFYCLSGIVQHKEAQSHSHAVVSFADKVESDK